MRVIFFDEEQARAVVTRLIQDGYEARLERERLAGEDDDEDHPWAVLSDAPEFVVDLLADEHDGWLDHGDEESAEPTQAPTLRLPPLQLPAQPRRVKRPDLLGD